ncbi:MAG TPA: hypothetical protein VGF56_02370 [Rhizomicrobium sp.]|jgi:hypothetical protein
MAPKQTRRRKPHYSVTDLAEAMQHPLARSRSFADVLQLIAMGMERDGDENAPAVLVVAESLMDDLDTVQIAWGHLYKGK